MGQLALPFRDDEDVRKVDPLPPIVRLSLRRTVATPSAAELAILRAVELEDELARAPTPEERQRIHGRFAAEERCRVRESR